MFSGKFGDHGNRSSRNCLYNIAKGIMYNIKFISRNYREINIFLFFTKYSIDKSSFFTIVNPILVRSSNIHPIFSFFMKNFFRNKFLKLFGCNQPQNYWKYDCYYNFFCIHPYPLNIH